MLYIIAARGGKKGQMKGRTTQPCNGARRLGKTSSIYPGQIIHTPPPASCLNRSARAQFPPSFPLFASVNSFSHLPAYSSPCGGHTSPRSLQPTAPQNIKLPNEPTSEIAKC